MNPSARTLLKATLDGFASRNWIVEGIETSTSRRILTLQLGGAVRVAGPMWVEAGGRLPLAGRTFPAGMQLVLGLSGQLR